MKFKQRTLYEFIEKARKIENLYNECVTKNILIPKKYNELKSFITKIANEYIFLERTGRREEGEKLLKEKLNINGTY